MENENNEHLETKLHHAHEREEERLHREHEREEKEAHQAHVREEEELHREHEQEEQELERPAAPPDISLVIDGKQYVVHHKEISGSALRNLPVPPVAADRDLWLEAGGTADDVKILPSAVVTLKHGMVFYTAPSTINPGGA